MSENKPVVSVVIPVYNVKAYLPQCVDSVLRQTYTQLEIILVDDGSADGSGQLCEDYRAADSRVTVIHQENGGLSDARNTGLARAQGEYLYFLDSDDYLEPDALEKLAARLESSGADFVFFNAQVFSDEGEAFRSNSYMRQNAYPDGSGQEVLFRLLILDEYKPSACLSFFRRAFLTAHRLRFRRGIIGEDELFSFYAYHCAERVSYDAHGYYHRRMRPGSIMTSGNYRRRYESMHIIMDELTASEFTGSRPYNDYLSRICKSMLLAYSKLGAQEKASLGDDYRRALASIRANRYFRDSSIRLRLKNYTLGVMLSGVRKNIRKLRYAR